MHKLQTFSVDYTGLASFTAPILSTQAPVEHSKGG